MRKQFIIIVCAFFALVLSGCGVGNYSISSGVDDKASICFVDDQSYDIQVTIDDQNFNTKTVKDKEYKSRRNLKKTVQYSLPLTVGTHTVSVNNGGNTVYSKIIVVSTGETKIIRL